MNISLGHGENERCRRPLSILVLIRPRYQVCALWTSATGRRGGRHRFAPGHDSVGGYVNARAGIAPRATALHRFWMKSQKVALIDIKTLIKRKIQQLPIEWRAEYEKSMMQKGSWMQTTAWRFKNPLAYKNYYWGSKKTSRKLFE